MRNIKAVYTNDKGREIDCIIECCNGWKRGKNGLPWLSIKVFFYGFNNKAVFNVSNNNLSLKG